MSEFSFNEKKEMDSLTLKDFQAECSNLFELRSKYEEADRVAKDLHAQLEEKKSKILAYLQEYNLDKFHVAGFGTIGTQNKYQVKIPSDPEKKQKLLSYLRDQGLENMLTVNHQTLNAFYNSKKQEALANGESSDNLLPGVDEPSIYTNVTMRRDTK